ncbi:MAG: diguanylate cyclase [Myxococcales bacterium]
MARVFICGTQGAEPLVSAFERRGCQVSWSAVLPETGELPVSADAVVLSLGIETAAAGIEAARALTAQRTGEALVVALVPEELPGLGHSLLATGVDDVATTAPDLVERVLSRVLSAHQRKDALPALVELAQATGGTLDLDDCARAVLTLVERTWPGAQPLLGLAARPSEGERDRLFRCTGELLEHLGGPLPEELQRAIATRLPVCLEQRLTLPLLANGVCLGALTLELPRSPQPDGTLATARAMVTVAANALYNALQHARVEKRKASLETAYLSRYRELLEANRRLRELNHLKDEFLAICAHDLRSPLNVVLGHSRLLLDGVKGPLTPAAHAAVESITRQARRILELVEDLLDLRAIETGRLELKRRDTDLVELVNEACDGMQLVAREQGIVLGRTVPDRPLTLYVDPTKVREVVMNLLSNAVKFTPAGGRVEVTVAATAEGGARLAVRDTGPGIPADELPQVFERYRRGREGRANGRGTGLGLAISREIVELHGGSIVVESDAGHGTLFVVSLPQLSAQARMKAHAARTRPLVLVAEDDGDSRAIIAELLSSEYDVVSAEDGEDAVRLARERCPDLILLDIFMPRLDGFAAMEDLRRDPRTSDTPVIILSAQGDDLTKVRGLNLGAADYLAKPFSGRELLARVEKTLKVTQQRKALRALAETDALTNLPNFRAFKARLEEEFKRARRYRTTLACVMLDLDNLKVINDRLGHAAGNRAIALIAETISSELRETDFAARYGGDEFVVLLPHANEHEAAIFAERLRERVASCAVDADGQRIGLCASIGVASSDGAEADSPDELWRRADGALYAAKKGGRNRVVKASEPAVGALATATH